MPSISIIVPVYNVETYLEFCVASLRKQTLRDIEIILVDDGSPDASGAICDRLAAEDERIRVIHKENGGLSSARNAGIDVATGDYLGFVDSDDWVEEDMFAHLLELACTHDADIVDCDMIEISQREFVELPFRNKTELLEQKGALDIFFRISKPDINYCVCDKIFKRELFEKVRFTEGIIFEDIDFNYRVLIHARRIVETDKIGYYYFKNPEGISRNSFRKKDLELQGVWDNIIELSKTHTPEYLPWAQFNRKRADFGLICKMFKFGCRENAQDHAAIRKTLLASVRKNFLPLIKGKLPFNRKVLLLMMCMNYRLVEYPLTLRRKLLRSKNG
ncbi:MAG: glycosyltransferase [Clostridia bacterium]|nr:glycosyltransferase [Clostridia bacterium]